MTQTDGSKTPSPQQQKKLQDQAKKKLKDALKRAKTQKMWFAFVYKNKMNARLMMAPKRITTKEIEQAKKDTKGVLFASGFTSVSEDDAIVFECLKKPFKTLDKLVKEHAAKFAGVPSLKVQARQTNVRPPKTSDDEPEDDDIDPVAISRLFEEESESTEPTPEQTRTLKQAQDRLQAILAKKLPTDHPPAEYLPILKAKNMVNRLAQTYKQKDWDGFAGAADDIGPLLTAAEQTAIRLASPPRREGSGEPGSSGTPPRRSEPESRGTEKDRAWREQSQQLIDKLKRRVKALELPQSVQEAVQKNYFDKMQASQESGNRKEFQRLAKETTDYIKAWGTKEEWQDRENILVRLRKCDTQLKELQEKMAEDAYAELRSVYRTVQEQFQAKKYTAAHKDLLRLELDLDTVSLETGAPDEARRLLLARLKIHRKRLEKLKARANPAVWKKLNEQCQQMAELVEAKKWKEANALDQTLFDEVREAQFDKPKDTDLEESEGDDTETKDWKARMRAETERRARIRAELTEEYNERYKKLAERADALNESLFDRLKKMVRRFPQLIERGNWKRIAQVYTKLNDLVTKAEKEQQETQEDE